MTVPAADPGPAIEQLVDLCAAPTGLPDLFNPYRDRRPDIDLPDAPRIRRRNLARYLSAVTTRPVTDIWMAEAPGARSGACSGVPLVPESCFDRFAAVTGVALERATTGSAPATFTADAVWGHIGPTHPPVLWNTVLHHPHPPGRPHANRTPRALEVRHFEPIRTALQVLAPGALVVAIGRIAHRALTDSAYVRHPAQGGRTAFDEQLDELYRQRPSSNEARPPR